MNKWIVGILNVGFLYFLPSCHCRWANEGHVVLSSTTDLFVFLLVAWRQPGPTPSIRFITLHGKASILLLLAQNTIPFLSVHASVNSLFIIPNYPIFQCALNLFFRSWLLERWIWEVIPRKGPLKWVCNVISLKQNVVLNVCVSWRCHNYGATTSGGMGRSADREQGVGIASGYGTY